MRMRVFSSVLLLCLLLSCLIACGRGEEISASPAAHVLDVGQGSSILIRTSEGDILVDAGRDSEEARLIARLEQLGVERLALLILTHGDPDHSGGADGVLKRFGADAVWVNGAPPTNQAANRLNEVMVQLELEPQVIGGGEGKTLGEVSLAVLAPLKDAEAGNDASLVIRLSCGNFVGLIMGDASARLEKQLLEAYGESQLRSDVLFVGHHGSGDACSASFLQAVQPTHALISCGAGNSHGHPDGRTLERLNQAEAEVLRTDLNGEICVSITDSPIEGERCYEVIPSERKKADESVSAT